MISKCSECLTIDVCKLVKFKDGLIMTICWNCIETFPKEDYEEIQIENIRIG